MWILFSSVWPPLRERCKWLSRVLHLLWATHKNWQLSVTLIVSVTSQCYINCLQHRWFMLSKTNVNVSHLVHQCISLTIEIFLSFRLIKDAANRGLFKIEGGLGERRQQVLDRGLMSDSQGWWWWPGIRNGDGEGDQHDGEADLARQSFWEKRLNGYFLWPFEETRIEGPTDIKSWWSRFLKGEKSRTGERAMMDSSFGAIGELWCGDDVARDL